MLSKSQHFVNFHKSRIYIFSCVFNSWHLPVSSGHPVPEKTRPCEPIEYRAFTKGTRVSGQIVTTYYWSVWRTCRPTHRLWAASGQYYN